MFRKSAERSFCGGKDTCWNFLECSNCVGATFMGNWYSSLPRRYYSCTTRSWYKLQSQSRAFFLPSYMRSNVNIICEIAALKADKKKQCIMDEKSQKTMLRQAKTFLITTIAELADLYQSKQVRYHSTSLGLVSMTRPSKGRTSTGVSLCRWRWKQRSDTVLELVQDLLKKQHPRKLLFLYWVAQKSRGMVSINHSKRKRPFFFGYLKGK